MARFAFKLEPLLTARRHAERVQQRAMAEIERQRVRLEESIRRRQSWMAEAKQDLRRNLTGTLHAHDLRLYAGTALQHMREAQRLVLEYAAVVKRLESARQRLAEATTRRRAVELLRERRYRRWRRGVLKAETDALDELSVIRAAREEPDA